MSDAPTAYALALGFDLVTDAAQRTRLAARLAELVRERGYRIATGFVGTPLVADALAESGHLYTAERLLLQTECPSWLYPVTMGATTVWERWDSLLPDGSVNPGEMTSFNHYALGAVADWLHRTVAGLAPDAPGYRRIRIAPRPLGRSTHARAEHLHPVRSRIRGVAARGREVVVTAEVPPNTEAIVDLPAPAEPWSARAATSGGSPSGADAASRRPFDLDSPSAAIIDDPEAYRTLLDTLASHDPGARRRSAPTRSGPRDDPCGRRSCSRRRDILADVERALAAASTERHPMFDRSSTFGDALDDAAARAVLETFLPGIAASPMAGQFRDARLGQLVALSPALREDATEQERFWAALAEVPGDGSAIARRVRARDRARPRLRGRRGGARFGTGHPARPPVPRWGVVELRFEGRPRQPVRRRRVRCRGHEAASAGSRSAGSTTAKGCT